MSKPFSILMLLFTSFSYAQQATNLCDLNDSVQESSGLLYLNGKIITHNDSGDGPFLYEIDSLTGLVSRTVFIENAVHTDWEDLAYDDTYIYIGDFGNNNGNRTDLRIYRCSISDYFSSLNDTISADTIHFSYSDQTDFTSNPFNTNYDAEAFVAIGDSLTIFTKNWIDSKTNIYSLSNLPGTHSAVKIDSINSQGLVGGASFDSNSNQIILCGYATINPFILTIAQYTSPNFSSGQINRYDITLNGSSQLEGISSISATQHYLTTELNFTGDSKLHKLSFTGFSDQKRFEESEIFVYPNPTSSVINIASDLTFEIAIYDLGFQLIYSDLGNSIDVSGLESGLYLMKLTALDSSVTYIRKIVIE